MSSATGPNTNSALKVIPGAPESSPSFADYYNLYFRHGMNPTCQKGFHCAGGLNAAVARARQHCDIMGYRYIFVRPMVCNIDLEEKQRIES